MHNKNNSAFQFPADLTLVLTSTARTISQSEGTHSNSPIPFNLSPPSLLTTLHFAPFVSGSSDGNQASSQFRPINPITAPPGWSISSMTSADPRD